MNFKLGIVKSYVKASRVKSLLLTKPTNINKISLDTLKVDTARLQELEKDVFNNYKENERVIVGKVKIKNRNSNEFVYANIIRKVQRSHITLYLEYNGEDLIYSRLDNYYLHKHKLAPVIDKKNNKRGICIQFIGKKDNGKDYAGLGKIMDALTVKESQNARLGGKIYLISMPNATPLHWSRGFTKFRYTKNYKNIIFQKLNNFFQKKFNSIMQKRLNRYIDARKEGKDIRDAKISMNCSPISGGLMTLTNEALEKNIKNANKIRYS